MLQHSHPLNILLHESPATSARDKFLNKTIAVLGNGGSAFEWIFEYCGNRAVCKQCSDASILFERALSDRDLSCPIGFGVGNIAKYFVEHTKKRLFQIT